MKDFLFAPVAFQMRYCLRHREILGPEGTEHYYNAKEPEELIANSVSNSEGKNASRVRSESPLWARDQGSSISGMGLELQACWLHGYL